MISVGCAMADPEAYWGVVAMLLSAGTAFAFALRASAQPILWGPFRFVPAPSGPPAVHWRRTLCQTFAMWTVFFGLLPAGLVAIERGLGWQNQPWAWGGTQWTALALFAGAGIEGLRAGRQMCDLGGGTPLPSQGTTKLVTQGPYRYLRNPMAFFSVVQGLCLAYMAASPLVAVYAFLGAVWWEVLVRPIEEEHLRATFGREYEAYCDRVRCWWPSRLAK